MQQYNLVSWALPALWLYIQLSNHSSHNARSIWRGYSQGIDLPPVPLSHCAGQTWPLLIQIPLDWIYIEPLITCSQSALQCTWVTHGSSFVPECSPHISWGGVWENYFIKPFKLVSSSHQVSNRALHAKHNSVRGHTANTCMNKMSRTPLPPRTLSRGPACLHQHWSTADLSLHIKVI